MPNPSTIAMNDESNIFSHEVETKVIDGVEHTTTKTVTKAAVAVMLHQQGTEIALLKSKLAQAEDDFNSFVKRSNGEKIKASLTIGSLTAKNQDLISATAEMGKKLLEMEESRDRVLAENCAMTQKLRDLKKIARAAIEYRNAYTEYDESEMSTLEAPMPDKVVERMANADCELERLLEEHAELIQRARSCPAL